MTSLQLVLYCIVLYDIQNEWEENTHTHSIKLDWPQCKVVYRVGNQNTN